MSYSVKEVFYTLQGEGKLAGRPAVFCRFVGCNLWSGKEKDRAKAVCNFCDTDFLGGSMVRCAEDLASYIEDQWPPSQPNKFVVLTGGEPSLQVDKALIESLHQRGFFIAIETNGTRLLEPGIDWVCVSPKANTKLVVTSGDELKLVYPQIGVDPKQFELMAFDHFQIQPLDANYENDYLDQAVDFCKNNTAWTLSFQTHKALKIR